MDSIEANDGIDDVEELCRQSLMIETDRGAFAIAIGVVTVRGKSRDAKSRLRIYLEAITLECAFSSSR